MSAPAPPRPVPAPPVPRGIRCGHCPGRHRSVADVRVCSKAVGYRRWLAQQGGK